MAILKSSCNFDNTTDGFVCRFTGVECWNFDDENKVSALRLSSLGLEGQFPRGLEYCTSLDVLDLSNNNFAGPIPSNITRQVTYLTSLDLSYNSFSGEIPVGIARPQSGPGRPNGTHPPTYPVHTHPRASESQPDRDSSSLFRHGRAKSEPRARPRDTRRRLSVGPWRGPEGASS